ncbi:hypothetical protein [Solibacillus sp. R5-41]|nr:hypothetical protein [Solibacillus sp. R5-41]
MSFKRAVYKGFMTARYAFILQVKFTFYLEMILQVMSMSEP